MLREHTVALEQTIISYGSPFNKEGSQPIMNMFTKKVAPQESSSLVYTIEEKGKKQFLSFTNDVFITKKRAVFEPIKQNSINLFEEKIKK